MAKEIHSRDNRIYKECQKLSQKKYRDREGLYLIEGYNLLAEAPESALRYVLVREDQTEIFAERCPFGAEAGSRTYILSGALFDRLAQTETSQGVIAVMEKQVFTEAELTGRCGGGKNLIVLDRLQDPGNIGTIIRTAEGAGYAAVIVLKGTGDVYGPKAIRAAAGSVFRIPIIPVQNNREIRELADGLGKRLTVTCFDTDNYYYDADLSEDTALVIGNEGNGISEELTDLADLKVKIPMEGSLESLNASVAAGILMYEAQRRHGKL